MTDPVVPSSTYRLQLQPGFDFDAAAAAVSYLAALGISHAYSSPYLQAVPGSVHGYDVVDHTRVRDDLGGPDAHARFARAIRENAMGQVLDVVPNHMAITGRANRWWWDLLRHGKESRFARYFDVDWSPPEPKLRGKILMPILGDHYGRVLGRGELKLELTGDELVVRYFEHELPVDPATLDGAAPEEVLTKVDADPEALHRLLERQHYRLASWRTAGKELDYRRFFDISSLAALRMEEEEVFLETHAVILRWLNAGVLEGVRVDHPDGLRDPRKYCEWLQEAAPGAWVVVEKVLVPGERLPDDWPVAGTTGYEFLNRLTHLYLDPAGEEPLTALYQEFTGESDGFAEVAYRSRKLVLRDLLASDLRRLTAALARVCEEHRDYRDFARDDLLEVLREFLASLPVYRTYLRPGEPASRADRAAIDSAAEEVRLRRPDLDPELVAFLTSVLLGEHQGAEEAELVARFQQTSPAVTAKGVEDTAFYRYHRLVALNEVGGDPARFGLAPADFHAAAASTAAHHPTGMLSTSTHDTKRAEDVRARLVLLSEIPAAWSDAVRRWSAQLAQYKRDGLPDANLEYLLYQTLVGAHPIEADRLLPYLEKAAREAKLHTAWHAVDEGYEAAVEAFARAALADPAFTAELAAFVQPLIEPGRVNSLAWKLVELTSPGVPDLYQGSELWDLSLVDPDNRRPVDFALRRRLLGELDRVGAEGACRRADEGLPKLLVVQRALQLRRQRPGAFGPSGAYTPLEAKGARASNLVAFARGDREAITVVPRLVLGLAGGWEDTQLELPAGTWRNELTGEAVEGGTRPVAELLARFPVALLARTAG